jgi:toxin YoeB
MNIQFTPEAWEDYLYWQLTDKKILKRINELLKDAMRDPMSGKGKPEPLRYELQGCWSRRIDQEHRVVYQADEKTLRVISVRFHY